MRLGCRRFTRCRGFGLLLLRLHVECIDVDRLEDELREAALLNDSRDCLTGVLRLVFALSSHDVCALYPLLTYFLVVTHRSLATPARLTYYVFLVDVCLSGYLLATQSLLTYW